MDINDTLSGTPQDHRKRFYAGIRAVAAEESKFIEWRKSSAKSMLWLHGIRKASLIRVELNQ